MASTPYPNLTSPPRLHCLLNLLWKWHRPSSRVRPVCHLCWRFQPPCLLRSHAFSFIPYFSSTHLSLPFRLFHEHLAPSRLKLGFPGGSDGKESACNMGNTGLIPGEGRSPGEGNGNTLQYSCLESSMDRGAWQATVRGVANP